MTARVHAAITQQQLRDLACRGFHMAWIGDRIGVSKQTLGPIRAGQRRTVDPYTACCINRLYHQLAGTTSAEHGIREGAAASTRLIAARGGWAERGRAA